MQENYIIPQEIEDQIPDYFYPALFGELIAVFGWKLVENVLKYKVEDLHSGTCGVAEAFNMNCLKLGLRQIKEYSDSLDWYDSDLFFGIIEDRIIKYCIKDSRYTQDYYRYLIQNNRKIEEKHSSCEAV